MNQSTSLKQLVLDLCLPDDATFDNFYAGPNQELVKILQNLDNPMTQFVYLWGEVGCGRTHLLLASAAFYRRSNVVTTCLPLKDLKGFSPKILENLEQLSLLCLDDLDAIVGYKQWEEEILHCFNRLQQQQKTIIISANATPNALPFVLPDLKSRMASGIIQKVNPLDDKHKVAALQWRAQTLGLNLPKAAASFLLSRCSRDTTSLFSLLKKLDRAALEAQRILTIPFIKQVIDKLPS